MAGVERTASKSVKQARKTAKAVSALAKRVSDKVTGREERRKKRVRVAVTAAGVTAAAVTAGVLVVGQLKRRKKSR